MRILTATPIVVDGMSEEYPETAGDAEAAAV
jgi:hypothetical protein